MSTGNSELYKALALYQKWELSIIPIGYKSKKPLIKWEQYRHRRPDNAELGEWFGDGQSKNIGLITGAVSGNFVVLDYDDGSAFSDLVERWAQKRGRSIYEETPVVGTGRGFQVYLRTKEPLRSQRLNGLDIKGEGGYVVAPPSVHPSGAAYTFIDSDTAEILEIGSLEEVGIKLDGGRRASHSEPNWASQALQGVQEGERDDTCTRLAGYFKNFHPEDVTLAILKHWGQRCDPPFPEKEVEKCVKSVYRYRPEFPSIPSPIGCDVMDVMMETKGLSLQWAKDISLAQGEEVNSLWGTFLFPGSIHLLSGEAGVGKTTFLYNLAIRASRGEEFIGIPFPKPLRVLYLDLESPYILRARKLHLIAEGQPPEGLAFIGSASIDQNLGEIVELVREHGFDLVIVDTINEAFQTEKEDDNAEANRQMMAVRRLVQQGGCAVLLAHHIGKAEQGKKVYKARGASARVGAVDVVINLEGMSEDVVRLEMVKNRWVGGNTKLFLRKAGEDLFEPIEVPDEETSSEKFRAQDWMLEEFQSQAVPRKEVLARGTESGFSQPTLERALSDLTQLGKVERPRRGFYVFPSHQP